MMIMMMEMGKIKEQIQKIETPWLPYKYDILGYMKDEPNYSSRSPSRHPPTDTISLLVYLTDIILGTRWHVCGAEVQVKRNSLARHPARHGSQAFSHQLSNAAMAQQQIYLLENNSFYCDEPHVQAGIKGTGSLERKGVIRS